MTRKEKKKERENCGPAEYADVIALNSTEKEEGIQKKKKMV